MKFKVEVTQEDIKQGKQKNIYSCPLAKAIERTIGEEVQVVTDFFEMPLRKQRRIKLPNEAADFRGDFDKGFFVKPFTFEIDI